MGFTLSVAQNEYLPQGATEVHAIVTVVADEDTEVTSADKLTEIIIIDVSTSMEGERLDQARIAGATAIDQITDGARFAVIAGNHQATVVVPMSRADAATKTSAKDIVGRLHATGGTVIGAWLRKADELFAAAHDGINHALLLTDGKDEGEARQALLRAIGGCEGHFACDCRGVGTDWIIEELSTISSALLGTVDIIPSPAGMPAEFARIIDRAMSKNVGDVWLHLWTPKGSRLGYVKQVYPIEGDLTGMGVAVTELISEYPTGAWSPGESRDYHLCLQVPPSRVGEERLAGRVSIASSGTVSQTTLVRAIWTGDDSLTARICPEVAHYTGQADLAEAIAGGLDALKSGDASTATVKLGRAVALATEVNNSQTLKLLQKVVEVVDYRTGTVQLRPEIAKADQMALETRRTVTVRVSGDRGEVP